MAYKRHVLTFSAILMTSMLLTQFQNCAPAASSSGQGSSTGGEARVIEDWNKVEIQFASNEVQVHDEAESTGVSGLCNRSHNGAKLKWAIWAGQKTEAPLLEGSSACDGGQFSVELDELPNMVCGVNHLLVVEGDWGGSTFTHVLRRCQPLASEVVPAPAESPAGTECSLEYQIASGAGEPCTQVCYRDSKMILSRPVDANQCSSIAAKLAGP